MKENEITILKVNDIVGFENRLYKVAKSPFARNKKGNERGLRVILKLLNPKEFNDIILKGG